MGPGLSQGRPGWPFIESLFVFSVLGTIVCATRLDRIPEPYAPLSASLSTSLSQLNDFVGITLGMRRLSADLAWIDTLQYYGTEEAGASEFQSENGLGRYNGFIDHCRRTIKIDPHFSYVYYYCAGALGWNLNRLNEAEALLREGIRDNPTEWRMPQYLAAMAYQKNHNIDQLTTFLAVFVQDPNCPNLVRALLANLYAKSKNYAAALRIWFQILDTGDPAYIGQAHDHIQKIAHQSGLTGLEPSKTP